MKDLNKAQCPFKKIGQKLTLLAKKNPDELMDSRDKHMQYVSILRDSFAKNSSFYANIKNEFSADEINSAPKIKNISEFSVFINKEIKDKFWKGIIFDEKISEKRKNTFTNIGNLGIDDVTMILGEILKENMGASSQKILKKIDDEIFIRLKNNVLVDSILHLDEFNKLMIFENQQEIAQKIETTLDDNFSIEDNRFSKDIAPLSFQTAMEEDSIIQNNKIVPQATFGCPIVNLKNGEVFRNLIKDIIKTFL